MSNEHKLVTELKCACGHEQINGIEGLLHLGQCPCCVYCRQALRRYELAKTIADRLTASDEEDSPDFVLSHREIIADELARAKVTL